MAKGKTGPMELVGENVTIFCTDGNRITKETTYYGELEALGPDIGGARIKYSSHGSTMHSFLPFDNMLEVQYKEKQEKEEAEKKE